MEMEVPKKTWNRREEKRMVLKVGGGGIGAVVLLGGALATAALASAFFVGKRGRGSGEDGRGRDQNRNPIDELDGGALEHFSGAVRKEVESDGDGASLVSTQGLTMDEKPGAVINSEIPGGVYDLEAREQSICPVTPEKLEVDGIHDDFVVADKVVPSLNEELSLKHENTMDEGEVEIQLSKDDMPNEIIDESKDFEQVCVEDVRVEGESGYDGEIEGINGNDQGDIEVKIVDDDAVEGVHVDHGTEVDTDAAAKVGELPAEIVEVIQEGEMIEGGQEDEVKDTEEKLVENQEECDQPDDGIVSEKCEDTGPTDEATQSDQQNDLQIEEGEGEVPCENKEVTCPEDGVETEDATNEEVDENKTSMQSAAVQPKVEDVLETDVAKEAADKAMSPENIEVTKDDIAEGEVSETTEVKYKTTSVELAVGQPKQHEEEDNVEEDRAEEVDSSGTNDTDSSAVKDDLVMETSEDEENSEDSNKSFNDETNLSDEVEKISSAETGDSSTESNSETIWPAESLQGPLTQPLQLKLNREVEGKIDEDKAVKGIENFHTTAAYATEFTNGEGDSEKTLINRYMVELAKLKDHTTNLTRPKKLLIGASVVSSLSCSWFFGLSLVKLCLIVFLTMVLSKVHDY